MKTSIKSSDLQKLSPQLREEEIRKLAKIASSPPNGEIQELNTLIRSFEERFEISSEDLRRQLAQGKLKETWDICKWLMLLDQRDLLGVRPARSH